MRKKLFLAMLMASLSIFTISAAVISQPAATVYLIRNAAISVDDLEAETARYQSMGMDVTELDVLQTMINDEVFLQGAERDGVTVSGRQVDQMIDSIYQNAVQQAAQAGQSVTRDQFNAEVDRQFG